MVGGDPLAVGNNEIVGIPSDLWNPNSLWDTVIFF